MFKKVQTKNKLNLLVAPLPQTKAVTVIALFGVGSRFENMKNRGISHFIEHMMFKGTKGRPNPLGLTKEIDALGGVSNAFTSKDMTAYYMKVNRDHIDKAVEILSDMLQNSLFDKAEMEKEKGVILEEINMYEDTPMSLVEDVFEEELYGDQPIGRNVLGTLDSIKNMKRQDFVDYVKKNYLGSNMVLGFAGAVEEEEAKVLVEKHFTNIKSGRRPSPQKVDLSHTKKGCTIRYKDSEQTHLILGFPAYSYQKDDRAALNVLNVILGGNMSSRLFSVIREKYGMAYYIRTYVQPFADTGIFMVQSGLDNKRVPKAITLITKELSKIISKEVGKAELKRAKEFIKGHFAIQMEDSENMANWLTRQFLMEKRVKTRDEYLAEIDKVGAGDVLRVAKSIIKESKMNLGIIGPFKDKKEFIKLLKLKK